MFFPYALAVILAAFGVYLLRGGATMINLSRGEQMPGALMPGCARAVGVLLVVVAIAVAAWTFAARP